MRNAVFALLGATFLLAGTGCGMGDRMFCYHKPWGGQACDSCGCGNGGCGNGMCGDGGCGNGMCGNGGCGNGMCGDGGCGNGNGYAGNGCIHHTLPRGVGGEYEGAAGPPTGAVAYPYYTNRGPRDFLDPNPPSIGP